MSTSQDNRRISATGPFDDSNVICHHLQWQERLGFPFEGLCQLLCDDANLDPDKILGQPCGFTVKSTAGSASYFHGFAVSIEQRGTIDGLYNYQIQLRPWFDLLKHVGGCRIFQDQSALDIIQSIVSDRGFSAMLTNRLTGTCASRPYCVQFNESDFNFISRLMEEEGIYYFFEYTENSHVLVLADDVSAHKAPNGFDSIPYFEDNSLAQPACLFRWKSQRRLATPSCSFRDYDFEKPRAELTVRQSAQQSMQGWQWYRFPGRYLDADTGQSVARRQSESVTANVGYYSAEASIFELRCGQSVTVTQHPSDALNQAYIITAANVEHIDNPILAGASAGSKFRCAVDLIPSSIQYRPLPNTARPIASGLQVAKVVGKSGEEIWTDNYGRIKVQFAWDLAGQGDDTASCWIRVIQPWTGRGFGAYNIPRVGEEVLIAFIDADIDRPIVVGRVHNADLMPPETLADSQAKTVFRTRSTKGGDTNAFHELTFDDTAGAELIYMHSERDFQRVVENNDSLKVGFDKQSAGDQTIEVYNNQSIKIGVGSGNGTQTIEIGAGRTLTVDQGNNVIEVKQGDHTVKVDQGAVQVTAANSIELTCGSSSIKLTSSGITLKASEITLNSDGKCTVSAANISASANAELQLSGSSAASLKASGQLTLKGAMVMIN